MERFTDKDIAEKINIGYYGDSCNSFEIYTRCADCEDFMEKWKFDSIEEMDKILTDSEEKYFQQCKELQAYKQMWEELKKFIKTEYQTSLTNNEVQGFCELKLVETKMTELEKRVEVDNGNND